MKITATTRKTRVQGTECYFPALRVEDSDYRSIYVSRGDPLVTKSNALKYAEIWKRDTLAAGYVTYF
jgi:hypothetical protein